MKTKRKKKMNTTNNMTKMKKMNINNTMTAEGKKKTKLNNE